MRVKFYKAIEGTLGLQVITELGKNNISISISDKELNYKTITLNEEQSKEFKQFMRENDI